MLLYNNKIPRDRVFEFEAMVKLQGIVTVELIDAKTGTIKQKLRFKNLIVDVGLDRIGANVGLDALVFSSGGTNFCGVGTGSTAPSTGDTTLVTEVSPAADNRTSGNGGVAPTSGYVTGPPDYHWRTRTFLFTEAQGNGNLTEIGIFSAVTGGTMFMRQLLKDGGGTPTTIIKTASDLLRVTYELRMYPLASDLTFSRTISAVMYDITVRARQASTPGVWGSDGFGGALSGFGIFTTGVTMARAIETGTLGARTSEPSGTQTSASSVTWASYSGGNFYRDMTAVWEPGVANYGGGIGSVVLYDVGNQDQIFQVAFSPAFTKDNTKRLTLISRVSWAVV